jgi:hypothetical protein
MLIRVEDLPDGWAVVDQRRWRTGRSEEAWQVRARQLGGVTAWRSFANDSQDRWLWVQATPLAAAEDVEVALAGVWERALENLSAEVQPTGSATGPELTIPADRMKTLDQHTQGRKGAGTARYVAWSYRNVVSVLVGSADGEPWEWWELAALASRQSSLIDAVLSHP